MNIIITALLAVVVLFPSSAHAYIDPGAGSALIQGLVGLVVALAVTLKLYWHRILRFLRISKNPNSPETKKIELETPKMFAELSPWMRTLCNVLLQLLQWLHAVIPNWGLAIIALALLVRVLLYPIAKKAARSQQAFNEVQKVIAPQIAQIKRDLKGAEQSEAILALYKTHNVSPLAGLKPILILLVQLPIFMALYHVLGQATELKEASFLWMDSLAVPDQLFSFGTKLPFLGEHFNALPALMTASTILTMKLAPAPAADAKAARTQNIFLVAMALGFFFLFYHFASGMVLYWTFANIFQLLQSLLMKEKKAATPVKAVA